MLLLGRSLWPLFTAGDRETHSPVCGGLCQTLTNACVTQELAVGLEAGLLPSPCFYNFLARTTFVLESLPEAKNPGQDAFFLEILSSTTVQGDPSECVF